MHADVKGDIYEGLLAKSAQESPEGRGPVLHATRTDRGDRRLRAAGARRHRVRSRLRTSFVQGWEIVPATARLCITEPLPAHGISPDESPIRSGVDSLANDPGERFSMVLTNPPFGKKGGIQIVNEKGELTTESTPTNGRTPGAAPRTSSSTSSST